MRHLFRKILSLTILNKKDKNKFNTFSDSQFKIAAREFWILAKRSLKDIILITIGILSATFGFKGFLLTNHFIDGGATGISLLVSVITKIPLHYLIIVINIPFIVLAYIILGKKFAIKTILAIAGLAISLATLSFPNITNDNLLVAVFGGFFLGSGIGFAIRGGAVLDGTEVLAIFLSKKLGLTIGDIIIVVNVIIFSVAAYFLGIEIALYSMITYLSASKSIDFLVEGLDEYIGVTIISENHKALKNMIVHIMGRGVTVYSGKQGFGKTGITKEKDILFTVVTRLELNKLNTEIEKIDPHAFVVMNSIKDTKGGMIKKRAIPH